ncbi:MAG: glycosyltransferase [Cyanobacteria bacterium J06635_15]
MVLQAFTPVQSAPPTLPPRGTKISFFLPNLDGGGAERVFVHLAEGFVEKGYAVDLVLAEAEGPYLAKVPGTINVVDLQARSPVLLSKTIALKRYLQQETPAALLTTLDIFNSAAWARRMAKVLTRVIMVVQTNLTQQFRDRHSPPVHWMRAQAVRQFYPWAQEIVAASKGVAEDVAQMSGVSLDKIDVIYNPVVKPELHQRVTEPVDHPWFTPEQPPVILGVGRLVKQKDFATLVKAFALVRAQRPCRLMILGKEDPREPEIKPELDRLGNHFGITEDMAFPGFVENPYAYMARADVFALSSIYEGFGNVVAEAIATGTAVVSTDCESGPAEILDHGRYGKLAPVGDVRALAAAISETLDHPTAAAVLKDRAIAFSVETIVNQYLTVIQRALHSPSLAAI